MQGTEFTLGDEVVAVVKRDVAGFDVARGSLLGDDLEDFGAGVDVCEDLLEGLVIEDGLLEFREVRGCVFGMRRMWGLGVDGWRGIGRSWVGRN